MSTDAKTQQLTVESSLDLLLVLLYAPGKSGSKGEPIEGITRLQKLVFLLQQGKGPRSLVAQAQEYLYRPYRMGPYADQLNQDVDVLTALGLVRTERLRYLLTDDSDGPDSADEPTGIPKKVESLKYCLTSEGESAGQELWASLTDRNRQEMSEFKTFFNQLSLRQLLIFVYESYPSFTTKSEIKSDLGL